MKVPQKEIDWAIAIAEKLPEKFQQSAFSELLRFALNHDDEDEGITKRIKPNKQKLAAEDIDTSGLFPDLDLLASTGNKDQHVAWAVAELHARGEDVNNEAIRKIIREHLAIAPPSRQNTNRSLRSLTPKYVTRTKMGKKYSYAPSQKISEIFNDLKDDGE